MSSGLLVRFAGSVWITSSCSESSLRRALASYVSYYQSWRTHLSLGKDAPQFRRTQACAEGKVVEIREVGGLHHHYERQAA